VSRVRRAVAGFVRGPGLPGAAAGLYRHHLRFAVLDAAATGILANVPLMAVKGLGATDREVFAPLLLSSAGMLLSVWTAGWMAGRSKKPFVLVPGLIYALTSFATAAAPDALSVLVLYGVGALFEVITRPALTAVIRLGYPVTHRGVAMGEMRKWCSVVFLTANLLSSVWLDRAGPGLGWVMTAQLVGAGCLSLAAYACFRKVHVPEPAAVEPAGGPSHALRILRTDGRFRRYLAGCFLFGFSGLLYVSLLPNLLVEDLHFGYVESALLIHIVPGLAAFLLTGYLGRWLDRSNPLFAWALVRAGWGLDGVGLAAMPALAALVPGGAFLLCALCRTLRGAVMGGSWVLWWQLGTNYFCAPGPDTPRYMGLLTALNGVMRLAAALAGLLLLGSMSRSTVFLIGGTGVLLSAGHAWAQWRAGDGPGRNRTFADAERADCSRGER
jgi:hypothetical protein